MPTRPLGRPLPMDTTRRGNYESGTDYVLEYGELRFTFNEGDFVERVEQAALRLGFVDGPLGAEERDDLVNLTVNGEVSDPASALGEHVNEAWDDLTGPSDRSLVHWLRRLVFRGAWLDQRVKEGELEPYFDESHPHLRLRPAGARLGADRADARALLGRHRLPPLARRSHRAARAGAPAPHAAFRHPRTRGTGD